MTEHACVRACVCLQNVAVSVKLSRRTYRNKGKKEKAYRWWCKRESTKFRNCFLEHLMMATDEDIFDMMFGLGCKQC